MKLQQWKLAPRNLARMSAAERSLMLLLGHTINEINVLNKLFHLSNNYDHTKVWLRHAHLTQALTLARALTGKLHEAWALIKKGYYRAGLSKTYGRLLDADASSALASLKQYFGRENLISKIRNSFSFHYDLDDVAALSPHDMDASELVLYIGNNNGNTLFYASEVAVNHAILVAIDPNRPETSFDKLLEESSLVVGWLNEAASGIMASLAEIYLRNRDGTISTEQIEIGTPPYDSKVSIPYFLSHRRQNKARA